MAEQKPLNRGAKDLKKKLEKARVKGADARARKGAKVGSGTVTERVKGAAKATPEKRGLPAIRKDNLPEVSRKNLPAIRKDNLPSLRKEKLPTIRRPLAGGGGSLARGIGGAIARGAFRTVGGPAVMLASMTTPTGDGQEDKPSGPLMKGGRLPGYKYAKRDNVLPSNEQSLYKGKPERVIKVEDYPETPPKPRLRPAQKSAKTESFKAKMQGRKATPKAKMQGQKAKAPSFRGNWTGAAPTPMQARGGKKTSRPSFMSLIKGK